MKAQAYCLLAEIQRPACLLAGLHSNPCVTTRFYSFGTEPRNNYNCSTNQSFHLRTCCRCTGYHHFSNDVLPLSRHYFITTIARFVWKDSQPSSLVADCKSTISWLYYAPCCEGLWGWRASTSQRWRQLILIITRTFSPVRLATKRATGLLFPPSHFGIHGIPHFGQDSITAPWLTPWPPLYWNKPLRLSQKLRPR